jgi:hypothetical protein
MVNTKIFREFLTIEDLDYIETIISTPNWSCFHKSNIQDPNASLFWQMGKLENDEFFSVYLLNKIKEITGDNFELERIYFNAHNACSQGYQHTDSKDKNGRTFLVYCNRFWSFEHGGGTSILNENREVETYFPYPRSAIYFQNNLEHLATPISKDFKGVRVTLAFKLFKI